MQHALSSRSMGAGPLAPVAPERNVTLRAQPRDRGDKSLDVGVTDHRHGLISRRLCDWHSFGGVAGKVSSAGRALQRRARDLLDKRGLGDRSVRCRRAPQCPECTSRKVANGSPKSFVRFVFQHGHLGQVNTTCDRVSRPGNPRDSSSPAPERGSSTVPGVGAVGAIAMLVTKVAIDNRRV
jgi:hypothetical protein